jgi:hypothetical protein
MPLFVLINRYMYICLKRGEGMSTFLYLGSSQIINDTPLPQKNKKTNPLNAISDAQF